MQIDFNEEKHEYKINGFIVPSVTQILEQGNLIDLSIVPKRYLEPAKYRGHAIHYAIDLHNNGILDEDSLDEEWRPHLEAWKSFEDDYCFQLIESELIVASKKHMFAGTLDIIGTIEHYRRGIGQFIIDLKPGQKQMVYSIQTSGYEIAYKEMFRKGRERIGRMCVFLKKDGTYKVYEHEDENDLNVFLATLTINNWKENNHGIKRS